MLNPHNADEQNNDPTIRRCISFARSWDFSSLEVVNLFSARTGIPSELSKMNDPVGPETDHWIVKSAARCNLVIAAWGNHGSLLHRSREVADLLHRKDIEMKCFRKNLTGEPAHPLYMPGNKTLDDLVTYYS